MNVLYCHNTTYKVKGMTYMRVRYAKVKVCNLSYASIVTFYIIEYDFRAVSEARTAKTV